MSYDRVIRSRVHVRMLLVAFVLPRQERPERGASVTIEGFLLGAQFGEGLADLGKVEKRDIAETVSASRRAQAAMASGYFILSLPLRVPFGKYLPFFGNIFPHLRS